ncbi:MAG TPA: radical SAM protein [Candidatus Polarisedimenticolia bacterium]|jgi:MoaA/NifB/PqqE/SkfB family radical SAM enzyme
MTSSYPSAPLDALDTLWLQVSGTLCNLACTHCFISCSPTNHTHEMMRFESVMRYLEEAEALGVKEYYLTGGEPLMHPRIMEILRAALAQGPVSILTNGLLIRPETAARLKGLSDGSEYSLDLRISIDGYDAATNDPIRGAGTFQRILEGIRNLAEAGLPPVVTVTEACEGAGTQEGRRRFLELLAEIGLPHPRLKVMPLLRLGAEETRSRGYLQSETLAGLELTAEQTSELQCSSCRMATERGVWVCPILLDVPEARMGATLADTLRPFELAYSACHTCHAQGLSCRT